MWGRRRGAEETGHDNGQDEQGKWTAASKDYPFHKIIPAWLCTLLPVSAKLPESYKGWTQSCA